MAVKLVIFDCDGVLVDSEGLSGDVLVEVSTEHGLPMLAEEAISTFRGMRMQECVDAIEAALGRRLPERFVGDYRDRVAAAFRDRLRSIDGAVDVISTMSLPFCVASSGPRDKIESSLAIAGLRPHFGDRIFSAYEVGHWKPDPRLFLHAASVMGVEPADCLVVEDSLPGLRAGVAAGMQVVALRTFGVDPLLAGDVEVIETLSQLQAVLMRRQRDAA